MLVIRIVINWTNQRVTLAGDQQGEVHLTTCGDETRISVYPDEVPAPTPVPEPVPEPPEDLL